MKGGMDQIIFQLCIQHGHIDAYVLTTMMVFGFCKKGYYKQHIQWVLIHDETFDDSIHVGAIMNNYTCKVLYNKASWRSPFITYDSRRYDTMACHVIGIYWVG